MCGDGSFGQLGNGDIQSCHVPSEVAFFSSKHAEVEEIACGIRHTLALVNGKTLSMFQIEPYRCMQLLVCIMWKRQRINVTRCNTHHR